MFYNLTPFFGDAFWILPRSKVVAPRVVFGSWNSGDEVTAVVGDYLCGRVVVLARPFREPVGHLPIAEY